MTGEPLTDASLSTESLSIVSPRASLDPEIDLSDLEAEIDLSDLEAVERGWPRSSWPAIR